MNILTRKTHGYADYAMVVVFLSVPLAFGLTGTPRTLSYSLAFIHLLVTAFSSFPPGAVPLLPFRFHVRIEILAGLFLIASPWLLKFGDQSSARSVFVVLGAVLLAMALLTDFERRQNVVPRPPGDRRQWFERKRG